MQDMVNSPYHSNVNKIFVTFYIFNIFLKYFLLPLTSTNFNVSHLTDEWQRTNFKVISLSSPILTESSQSALDDSQNPCKSIANWSISIERIRCSFFERHMLQCPHLRIFHQLFLENVFSNLLRNSALH